MRVLTNSVEGWFSTGEGKVDWKQPHLSFKRGSEVGSESSAKVGDKNNKNNHNG